MIVAIRYFLEILLLTFTMYISWMFLIFIHEMGHAVGYMLGVKDNDWNIELGIGKKLFKIGRFTIRLLPFYGQIFWKKSAAKTKTLAGLIGGPLASLFSLLLLFLLKHNSNSILTGIMAFTAVDAIIYNLIIINLSMFITSVVPMKITSGPTNGYISDGWRIMEIIKTNKTNK